MAGRNVQFVRTIPGRCALSVNDAGLPAPKGWAWVSLPKIARLESGHTPSRSKPEYWDGEIPWIGIKDARAHHGEVINDTSQHVTQAGIDNSAARVLPANTVCLSRTASVGYVVVMGRPMATSQDFVNWVCSPAIDPEFLKWIFLAEGEEGLRKFGKGTTHTTIYFPEVEAFHACIAPINEQRRIVAKLHAVFDQTRRAKARLGRLPVLLDTLKRSILAAAFRGDLTADWRDAHPNSESANALLHRIRAERKAHWEAALRAKGKDPSRTEYDEPRGADVDELPRLPVGWSWARAEETCEFITKGTTPAATKMNSEGGVPFIKVYNLTLDGSLDFSIDPTFVDPDVHRGELARSRVFPGDVLMNIVGPPLGKVSIVPNDHPEWNINQAIAVFRPLPGLHRDYLCSLLVYLGADRRTIAQAKATSGQLNLTLEICRNLLIPLPPEDEQRELAKRLDAAFLSIDMLAQEVRSALGSVDELERAALAKAFRGELVERDPNDEPASALIERIQVASIQHDARGVLTATAKRTQRGSAKRGLHSTRRATETIEG